MPEREAGDVRVKECKPCGRQEEEKQRSWQREKNLDGGSREEVGDRWLCHGEEV